MFAPILIVPILSLSLMAEPFVVSWVGAQYSESAVLVSFLVLCFIFNFVFDPINQYFVATERNRVLIRWNLMLPIIFWVGVFSLLGLLGLKAFAIMKFVSPFVVAITYWILASKDFKLRGYRFLSIGELLITVIPTIIIVFVSSWIFSHWMIEENTKRALFINLLLMGISICVSLVSAVPFNRELRSEVSRFLATIKKTI